ncbi:diguanylate cyclase [Orrella sp. JC864]|uniref:diguanylate cyclase n=1 Tax=Orrella sp. JC864 TaxID=3120298 RepID=UPI00300BB564
MTGSNRRQFRPAGRARPSLRQVLRRAHLSVAVIAVGLAGLAMTAVGLVALRAYANHNLQLIARSMAYTVEASVVFRDPVVAAESLALIASSEEVSLARVSAADGLLLAEWQRPHSGSFAVFEDMLADLLLPSIVVQPVVQGQREVGLVEVAGHGGALLRFLATGLAGLLICLVASTAAGIYLSRRLVGRITQPLRELAAVAHAVRRDRDLGQRVEPAAIAELNELGQDFNAVLDGFEAWQRYLQNENSSLVHRATHDSLTGLCNRAFFESRMSRAVRDAKESGERVGLLYVDANGFKEINDSMGHAAGDAVLSAVAARLRAQVRESDLVGRIGGDEFAVLLLSLHERADALRVAENLRACMVSPISLAGGACVQTSVSVGVAVYPDDGLTPQALMASADAAMYRAKAKHKGAALSAASGDAQAPGAASPDREPSSC